MNTLLIWFMQAFRKFDEMANKQTDKLRKLTKQVVTLNNLYIAMCIYFDGYNQVQEARHNHDEDLVKKTVEEYDETLEWYGVLYV